MEETVLPPGVSQQGVPPPTPPPAVGQQAAAPVTPEPIGEGMEDEMPEDSGSSDGKWNYLEIGAGILLTTVVIFSIAYFRYKTTTYSAKIKKMESKISSLASEVNSMQSQQTS